MNPAQPNDTNAPSSSTQPAPEESGVAAPKKYDYTCIEHSLLYPTLKKHVWAPAVPLLLPLELSANTMTITGNALAWLAFVILLLLNPSHRLLFVVPAVLNFLYLSLDNMDGIQARRNGRCSPLGEFLDHWFDSFIATMMVFGLGVSTRLEPWIMLLAMAAVSGAYFATFWEQRLTHKLVFGYCGSIEAILAISLIYLVIAIVGVEPITVAPLLFGFSFTEIMFVLVGVFTATPIIGAMVRVGRRWGDFLPHLLVYGGGALWYGFGKVPLLAIGFLYLLSCAHFGGRLVIAKVLDEEPRIGDPVLYALLAAGAGASFLLHLEPMAQGLAALPALGWIVFKLCSDFHHTVSAMREHLSPSELLAVLMPRT